MMEERILVVDDERHLEILQYNLRERGFIVDVASSAEEIKVSLPTRTG